MKRLLLFVALAMVGCMPPPPLRTDIDRLEMGMPPDSTTISAAVRGFFETQLYDPMTAVYKYGEQMPVWFKPSDGPIEPGWGMTVSVNAKNRMGGYVGFAQYLAIFRDDRLRALWPAYSANATSGRRWGWR
jgi:hypothetical protein